MTCTIIPRVEEFPERLHQGGDHTYVIIDVLNFSTTVISLLENKAKYVRPYDDVDEARKFQRRVSNAVLVGEDQGEELPGFDYFNSPSQIEPISFEGKPVAVKSSNGTRAVKKVKEADSILVGSTVNAKAIAAVLKKSDNDIYLLAAGKAGSTVAEDIIGAEMIQAYYKGDEIDEAQLKAYSDRIRSSKTADHLRRLGFEADIDIVLHYNSTDITPQFENGKFVSMNNG